MTDEYREGGGKQEDRRERKAGEREERRSEKSKGVNDMIAYSQNHMQISFDIRYFWITLPFLFPFFLDKGVVGMDSI